MLSDTMAKKRPSKYSKDEVQAKINHLTKNNKMSILKNIVGENRNEHRYYVNRSHEWPKF